MWTISCYTCHPCSSYAVPWWIVAKIQKNVLALFWRNSGLFFFWLRSWLSSMLSCFLTLLWKNSFGLENDQFYPVEKYFCKTSKKDEVWITVCLQFCCIFFLWTQKPVSVFIWSSLLETVFRASSDLYRVNIWRKKLSFVSWILLVLILGEMYLVLCNWCTNEL